MKLGWRAALGILLSAALLWWVLRDVPFAVVLAHVRQANVPLLLLSSVVGTLIFPLRAVRWRPILDPVAPGLPFRVLFPPVAIGIMVSNVVPGRVGEIARPLALTRETDRVPFSAAIASVAVDRVFDAVIILTLMLAGMMDPAFAPGARVAGRTAGEVARGGLVLAVALWVALYLMVFFPAPVERLVRAVARPLSARFEERIVDWYRSFVQGLSVLRSPGRFAAVLWWTLVHWLVCALSYWIAFLALGLDLSFGAALFLQGLIAIGVAVPQAPGFWGGFEALAAAGLAVYGVSQERALAWGFAFHFVSWLPITAIGIFYFGRLGMRFGELRRPDAAPPAPRGGTP